MFRSNAIERKDRSIYNTSFRGYNFQGIHKKAKCWFIRKLGNCLKILYSVIEQENIRCIGENFGKEEKEKELDKQCSWHKRGEHETVMFVEAITSGQSAKTCRKALKKQA